jgi:hypothetical protein
MPVDIAVVLIIGMLLMMRIIRRRQAGPEVVFREDTMRYITMDPDRTKRNHAPLVHTQQAAQPKNVETGAAVEPEHEISRDETPERQAAPLLVLMHEGDDDSHDGLLEVSEASEPSCELPDLLVRDDG